MASPSEKQTGEVVVPNTDIVNPWIGKTIPRDPNLDPETRFLNLVNRCRVANLAPPVGNLAVVSVELNPRR